MTACKEQVPISNKCFEFLLSSSLTSLDRKDLFTFGPPIPRANRYVSKPSFSVNSRKWATIFSDLQCPTNNKPQYEASIFFDVLEYYVIYRSCCFFWVVDSSNLKKKTILQVQLLHDLCNELDQTEWYISF